MAGNKKTTRSRADQRDTCRSLTEAKELLRDSIRDLEIMASGRDPDGSRYFLVSNALFRVGDFARTLSPYHQPEPPPDVAPVDRSISHKKPLAIEHKKTLAPGLFPT